MIKRVYVVGVTMVFMAALLLPGVATAATASVFVSPSSTSVEKGKTVTVQVRVNSGTDAMDSAQARLNFDSSRLSYVSHASGDFTPFQQTPTSSSFEYVGLAPGGTSGNRLLFSVTFKAQNTGTASLSLSGARVAAAGGDLSLSVSGGTISVTAPPVEESPSSSTKPPSSDTTSKPPVQSPTSGSSSTTPASPEEVVEPPTFTEKPVAESTQSTITVRAGSDKDSQLRVRYGLEDEDKSTLETEELSTAHEAVIGVDNPLRAGRVYQLEVTLFDEEGTTSDTVKLEVKTKGVTYKVKVADKQGVPLVNYPVELFSDPIAGMTDENGVATFEDVTPGEHTLVFDIDGITIRQPVVVAESLAVAGATDAIADVALPFSIANDTDELMGSSEIRWDIAIYAGLLGALLATLMQHGPSRRFFLMQASHIKKVYRLPRLHIDSELRLKGEDKHTQKKDDRKNT